MAHQFSDSTFETEVLQNNTVTVVDFWAEWCGPCRAIGPTLEEIAGDLEGKVKVVKINIDENPETPAQYRIRSIPTLMLFQGGALVSTKVGSLPKNDIIAWIGTAASVA